MTQDLAPLQALLLPFDTGVLARPRGGVLFLNARAGWPLQAAALEGLVVEQDSRPEHDALVQAGHAVLDGAAQQAFPTVLALPPRQREASRACLARALACCDDGGLVVASVANAAGAKSAEADLRALAGLDGSLSKHHCRVFWVRKDTARLDATRLAQWQALDAPRVIETPRLPAGGFLSRPGVFAWNRIDPASALLADHLPTDLAGAAADLGAGWGFLALATLQRNPGLRRFDLYEAQARALALARQNLANLSIPVELGFHWHDVTTGVPAIYDVIVSNPPFHAQDRADRPELGQRFIAVAAQALRPGGRLFLVANRHLPYEADLAAHFGQVQVLAQADGFKVVSATRGAA